MIDSDRLAVAVGASIALIDDRTSGTRFHRLSGTAVVLQWTELRIQGRTRGGAAEEIAAGPPAISIGSADEIEAGATDRPVDVRTGSIQIVATATRVEHKLSIAPISSENAVARAGGAGRALKQTAAHAVARDPSAHTTRGRFRPVTDESATTQDQSSLVCDGPAETITAVLPICGSSTTEAAARRGIEIEGAVNERQCSRIKDPSAPAGPALIASAK